MKTGILGFVLIHVVLLGAAQDGVNKPDLYIVSIGVSVYKNYPDRGLKYAADDAKAILQQFSRSKAYRKIIPLLLINDSATRGNILQIRQWLLHSRVDDQVILFFSGHGYLDTAKLDLYLCLNPFKIEERGTTGLTFDEMEGVLDSIPARKKLLLIDACYSGEVDKETFEENRKNLRDGLSVDRGLKDISPVFSSRLVRQTMLDLMKEQFIDVRRRTGSTIITSSGGLSVSYEKDQWKSGLFTYAVISSLKENITINELKNDILSSVRYLSGGSQAPFIREENNEMNYVVW
jgi:hypothetical protein